MNVSSASAWLSKGRRYGGAAAMALACFLGAFALCQPPSTHRPVPSTSTTKCGECHREVVNSYAHAPMRHAMEPPGADPVLEAHPRLSVSRGGYTYTILTKDGKSTYTVSDGNDSLTLPILWMFGQHTQTWVLERDGYFYEGLVSYFAKDQALDITPGDEVVVPHTLTEAMGRKLSIWEMPNCVSCHTTGYHPEEKPVLQKLTPGLNCERCHAGALQHAADAEVGNWRTIPASLKTMDARETDNFCGQCHRTWDSVVRKGLYGPPTVRFEAYRLENSKCFNGKDRRISCLACHDPHEPVNHDPAYYDSKCVACHSSSGMPASAAVVPPKTCPVATKSCVSCHMPKVLLPTAHAAFTDHQIRIARAGDPYPN